jgi:hypothetical protein
VGVDVGVDADDDVDDLSQIGQTGHCVPPKLRSGRRFRSGRSHGRTVTGHARRR